MSPRLLILRQSISETYHWQEKGGNHNMNSKRGTSTQLQTVSSKPTTSLPPPKRTTSSSTRALPELSKTPSSSSGAKGTSSSSSTMAKQPSPAQPSEWIARQLQFQQEQRCDYAVILYSKDPASPAGKRPNYLVDEVIPVKLSHQIFMQLSFGILRDRLLTKKNNEQSEYEAKMKPSVPLARRGTHSDSGPSSGGGGGRGSSSSSHHHHQQDQSAVSRDQDVVALFTFLQKYIAQYVSAKKQATGVPTQQMYPNLFQQLRFQMLVEHGVDVQTILRQMQERAEERNEDWEAAQTAYWSSTLCPSDVTEEEFMLQVSKPSGMAQECVIC